MKGEISICDGRLQRLSIDERFWGKALKSGPDECWLWLGSARKSTREPASRVGQFRVSRELGTVPAHRFAWELTYGPVADGHMVYRNCSNCRCVNPRHLRAGPERAKSAVMVAAGRQSRCERPPQAKLARKDVRAIRVSRDGGASLRALAAQYGVAASQIWRIVNYARWSDMRDLIDVEGAAAGVEGAVAVARALAKATARNAP